MKKNLTEIIFLLDRSGSMTGLESDTVGGFNSFVKKQAEMEGEVVLTTVLFDDQYEILWNGVNGKDVTLTEKEYYTRGATAMLDAIGKTILDVGVRLSKTDEDNKPEKVIFVITTDGMENSSREFTKRKVKKLIEHQQRKYNWEFIFLGANIDSVGEARSIGIAKENAFDYEASEVGVERMYSSVCKMVARKRKG